MLTPVAQELWVGRDDSAEGPAARRWFQCVQVADLDALEPHPSSGGTDFRPLALLGFACDAGVARNKGRVGAKAGPGAIRRALAGMAWHVDRAVYDLGDVVCTQDELESAQDRLANAVARALGSAVLPVVLGGGHEVAWGSWLGLAHHLEKRHQSAHGRGAPRVGVLNFDAHFDLRLASAASSGTPFRQIAEDCAALGWDFRYACLGVAESANTRALFERARSLSVWWELDESMVSDELQRLQARLQAWLAELDHLYLSFCLDVLPGSVAPGVSAPAALGVEWRVLAALLGTAVASGKLLLADIAEMNPQFDQDQRTARLAARWVERIARGCA